MPRGRTALAVLFLLPAAAAIGALAGTGAATSAPARKAAPALRVDQLGYVPGEAKVAYLIAPSALPAAKFTVRRVGGAAVLHGTAGASRGRWNATYGAVQPLDLSALDALGVYRVLLDGTGVASAPFRIGAPAKLFGPRVREIAAFFEAQRDGRDVIPGPLHRKRSHLNDRTAGVYDWPTYENEDSDVIVGDSLKRIGGPVDLEGGWFDAGDFIKFTHTTAYADTLLLASQRALGPAAPANLDREIRFGLRWLDKAWDERSGVMYIQVGIGSGNQDGTFNGDHDLWRLPERDDHLKGKANRYLRNRTAFRANAPGAPVPPNLAGRVSATYALAAQVDAASHPARARAELATAAAVFAAAKTTGVTEDDVVTALPHAFYPESSWRDDMELGAAELALAGQALGDARTAGWLAAARHWAGEYLAHEAGHDTLNLYDTSALAHADLVRALRTMPGGAGVGEDALVADLRAQLGRGVARANGDPFGAGVTYDDFDAAPHTFGLVATARLYRSLTGDARYDAFATGQRGWALGANAWGASLMIGVGRDFPRCPQHVVANLSGRLNGKPPILMGAVVNGPNDASLFEDGLGEDSEGMRRCPRDSVDRYGVFNGHGSAFIDDVRSWQTVEPAIDFSAAAALAFALLR